MTQLIVWIHFPKNSTWLSRSLRYIWHDSSNEEADTILNPDSTYSHVNSICHAHGEQKSHLYFSFTGSSALVRNSYPDNSLHICGIKSIIHSFVIVLLLMYHGTQVPLILFWRIFIYTLIVYSISNVVKGTFLEVVVRIEFPGRSLTLSLSFWNVLNHRFLAQHEW